MARVRYTLENVHSFGVKKKQQNYKKKPKRKEVSNAPNVKETIISGEKIYERETEFIFYF